MRTPLESIREAYNRTPHENINVCDSLTRMPLHMPAKSRVVWITLGCCLGCLAVCFQRASKCGGGQAQTFLNVSRTCVWLSWCFVRSSENPMVSQSTIRTKRCEVRWNKPTPSNSPRHEQRGCVAPMSLPFSLSSFFIASFPKASWPAPQR